VLAIDFLRRQQLGFDCCDHASPVSKESIRHLAKLLPGTRTPDALWEVCFEAQGEPQRSLHGQGVIVALVDPAAGECAIEP
jgi:hypothetical protein